MEPRRSYGSRNLSVNAYFRQLAQSHRPRYRFAGQTKSDWESWRASLYPALMASLGARPQKVPLNPEIIAEWESDGLIKQRVIFDVEAELSAVAYVFRPARPGTPRLPAILACHGHGIGGKDNVMGVATSQEMQRQIEEAHYDYGLKMAKAGYVVIAIDWRGFGERDDRNRTYATDLTWNGHRDPCELNGLRATMLGTSVLSMNIHDGMCALDYLCTQNFADPERIGVMGLSYGGTMTMWMALSDPRIKAANIICYSDRFADFGMRDVNLCGSQITQGIYALCDVPDMQGLLAPLPLLVEIGTHDQCFHIDSALSCYNEVEKIYASAGAREKLELDLFEGIHRWNGNKSEAFFKKYLSGDMSAPFPSDN